MRMENKKKEKKQWLPPKLIVLTRASVVEQVLVGFSGSAIAICSTQSYRASMDSCQ